MCKCVRQFGERIGRISYQEVRHVNFDDCSVYRIIEPRSICGHGLNIHHNLLTHKGFLKGINHQITKRFPRNSLLCFTLHKVIFSKVQYFLKVQFRALFHSLIQGVSVLRAADMLLSLFTGNLIISTWYVMPQM